jgi:hypothetical protein
VEGYIVDAVTGHSHRTKFGGMKTCLYNNRQDPHSTGYLRVVRISALGNHHEEKIWASAQGRRRIHPGD